MGDLVGAIKLNSTNHLARTNLGMILTITGDLVEHNVSIVLLLSWVLYFLASRPSNNLDPSDDLTRRNLGVVLKAMGHSTRLHKKSLRLACESGG